MGSKRETKMLSTMLYRAWISMENMMGMETLGTRRVMGIVPRSVERSLAAIAETFLSFHTYIYSINGMYCT